jgi:hypothetical protein
VSHWPAGAIVVVGHWSPVQHGSSSSVHAAPQWCCPGGQSTLPVVPVAPQQNALGAPPAVHPRAALPKQPC